MENRRTRQSSTSASGRDEDPRHNPRRKPRHVRHPHVTQSLLIRYKRFFLLVRQSRILGRLVICLIVLVGFVEIISTARRSSSEPFMRHKHGLDTEFIPYMLVSSPPAIPRVSGDEIWREAGYEMRPRVMGFYFQNAESDSWIGAQRLEPNLKRRLSHHYGGGDLTTLQVTAQLRLQNSDDYEYGRQDSMEEGDCSAQYDWQKQSYPTCNTMHEQDLSDLHAGDDSQLPVQFLANGYWRDVWMVQGVDARNATSRTVKYALKTMRYRHDFEERNYDRHRRDAVAMMQLSKSQYIVDIYAFCGNSGINEFSTGGDIEDLIWYSDEKDEVTASMRLIVACQAAIGLSHVHTLVGETTIPAIAHTDITTSQFVLIDGIYKLNDFNRARFITWDVTKDEACPFRVGNNPGAFRAPEEYNYEGETEKVDLYSLGNVFYCLLTDSWPFEDEKDEDAIELVMRGRRPSIATRFRASNETAHKSLLKAIDMCWKQDPSERATAQDIANFLTGELEKLGLTPGTALLSSSEDS